MQSALFKGLGAFLAGSGAGIRDMRVFVRESASFLRSMHDRDRAFSVITDELKRLSGRTIGLFASLEESLASGFSAVEADALGAGCFFCELMARARGVQAPLLRVMSEAQLQDIIRQSLQHVGFSLEEAPRCRLARGRQGLRRRGGRALHQPHRRHNRRARRERGELGGKRNTLATAKRMSEQARGLDESFKELSKLLSRFQTIVASRIEVAKTRALGERLRELHDRLRDLKDRLVARMHPGTAPP
jgi:hypothetical protein